MDEIIVEALNLLRHEMQMQLIRLSSTSSERGIADEKLRRIDFILAQDMKAKVKAGVA